MKRLKQNSRRKSRPTNRRKEIHKSKPTKKAKSIRVGLGRSVPIVKVRRFFKRRPQLRSKPGVKKRRTVVQSRRRKLPPPIRRSKLIPSARLHLFKVPTTVKQYLALSDRDQDTWDRIVQVPALLRSKGWSLRRAAYELSVPQELVRRLARDAFRKLPNGRIVAKKRDRLLRLLPLPSDRGLVEVFLNDSRKSSRVGEYWNAVNLFINTGDSSAVQLFEGDGVTDINGQIHFFLTDFAELRRQASFGTLRFESIYGRTAQ